MSVPILAVDPGTERSAWLLLSYTGQPMHFGIDENNALRKRIVSGAQMPGAVLAVEMIASYGMPVGRETFETCVWIGRFVEAWGERWDYVYRREVKLHLCHSARAKDANVRQALLDRFGPGKRKAVGIKASPGPLYGVKADIWSALAVAVTYHDRLRAAGQRIAEGGR